MYSNEDAIYICHYFNYTISFVGCINLFIVWCYGTDVRAHQNSTTSSLIDCTHIFQHTPCACNLYFIDFILQMSCSTASLILPLGLTLLHWYQDYCILYFILFCREIIPKDSFLPNSFPFQMYIYYFIC